MEIIENMDEGIRSVRKTLAQDVIPGSTRTDVENSAFSQTFRELFSRGYNPVALLRRHHELQKSK